MDEEENTPLENYYSLRAILTRSPDDLKDGVLVIAGAIVAIFFANDVTPEQLVLGGGALLAFLRLAYVGPTRRKNKDDEALKAIDLGKQLAAPADATERPLRGK